jgi:ribosomal protein L7/L12
VVSYQYLIVVVVLAFLFAVTIWRFRSSRRLIWEAAPQTGLHEAAIADSQLLAMLQQKQLVSAIKRYRQLTGVGLKESKEAVEALQRSLSGS